MRTPRVLARIPRLASSPLSATSVPSTSVPSTNVPLPVGDAADQVLLVEEPSVGAELELTLTTVAAQSGASTEFPTDGNAYFVDVAHSRQESAVEEIPFKSSTEISSQQTSRPKGSRRKHKRRRQSAPKSFSRSAVSGGWATNLSLLHAVLVPYSSLIVALALVASASLIYWLALGSAEATTDYREILSASTSAWPSAASEPSSELSSPPAEESTFQESLWSTVYPQPEVDLPAAGIAPESVAQVAESGTATQSTIAQAATSLTTTPQTTTSSPRFSLVDSQEPTASDLGMDGIVTPEESKEDFLSPLMPTADFAPLDFSRLEQLYWVYPEGGPNRTEQSSSAVADRSLNAPTTRRR